MVREYRKKALMRGQRVKTERKEMNKQNEEKRKERFERNFPFLLWDREVNSDRRLGHYLWFRDMVHMMRYSIMAGDRGGTIARASAAREYFLQNAEHIMGFGGGPQSGLDYLTEVNNVLDIGAPLTIAMGIGNSGAQITVRHDDASVINDFLRKQMDAELTRIKGKYWR
jgi:hypothetical protein